MGGSEVDKCSEVECRS